jgi:hypothetical protein
LQQPPDNIKQGLRSLYQAIAQSQAHLQFTQKLPTELKLQKSLTFFPPARIHFSNLNGFKTPTLKKLKPQTAFVP